MATTEGDKVKTESISLSSSDWMEAMRRLREALADYSGRNNDFAVRLSFVPSGPRGQYSTDMSDFPKDIERVMRNEFHLEPLKPTPGSVCCVIPPIGSRKISRGQSTRNFATKKDPNHFTLEIDSYRFGLPGPDFGAGKLEKKIYELRSGSKKDRFKGKVTFKPSRLCQWSEHYRCTITKQNL
jgi:hypothetical protein